MRFSIGWNGAATAFIVLLPTLSNPQLSAQTVGEPLPPWMPGTLDIHQISTGRGNTAFMMFPDGTSLLVDAGDGNPAPPRGAPRVPNSSRPAGEWIARYARRMLAHDSVPAIDYALITHFHGDHMAGLATVGEHIPIRMVLDRGWPDYDYPRPFGPDNGLMNDYRSFLEQQQTQNGMSVEQFQPGRADQIRLQREPGLYPTFEVRNVAVNGEVWAGVNAETEQHFPDLSGIPRADWPTENQCSLAIRVSYGLFDYYTGGDMPGEPLPGYPSWQGIEVPVAQAVGAVDAAVLNHHGVGNATTESFVEALQARVWIVPARMVNNPERWVFTRITSQRLYPGQRDIFSTSVVETTELGLGPGRIGQFKSLQGHIVIRVYQDGESYSVIVLDDSTEEYVVKAVHGPYEAR